MGWKWRECRSTGGYSFSFWNIKSGSVGGYRSNRKSSILSFSFLKSDLIIKIQLINIIIIFAFFTLIKLPLKIGSKWHLLFHNILIPSLPTFLPQTFSYGKDLHDIHCKKKMLNCLNLTCKGLKFYSSLDFDAQWLRIMHSHCQTCVDKGLK